MTYGPIITPTITYPITPTSLGLSESSLELTVPSTYQLTATVLPAEAVDKEVTWTSSNRSIATVGRNTGFVTAIAPGTATITATTSNGVSATCVVTVVEPTEKEYIYYSPDDSTLTLENFNSKYQSFKKIELTSAKEYVIDGSERTAWIVIPKSRVLDHFESEVLGTWYKMTDNSADKLDIVENYNVYVFGLDQLENLKIVLK